MNEHQEKKAKRLWELGHNTAEIGRAIKAKEWEVFNFLRQEREGGDNPVKNNEKKSRKCLKCEEDFESDHCGQRFCTNCKRVNRELVGGLDV